MHKSILYITNTKDFVTTEFDERISALNLTLDHINSLNDLPATLLLAKPQYALIIFDIPNLVSNDSLSVFEIINMIVTLTKCSKGYAPSIAVRVELTTDLKLLNDILATGINGIVPASQSFGVDETEKSVVELLSGRSYTPKYLIDRIKASGATIPAKKLKTTDNCIYLTARQEQVLRLICNRGASNKSIAKLLNISESTVKLHITAVLKKYGVRNRTQLALFASREYRV